MLIIQYYQKKTMKIERGRSAVRCLGPYDRIIAVINNMKVRDQEEKNKIFNMY